MRSLKIARVATVPFALLQALDQIEYIVKLGHEVHIITTYYPEHHQRLIQSGAKVKYIRIERKINLLIDILSLIKLFLYFSKEKFDIVHTQTPKAGFVGAIASFCSQIEFRVHTFTGQRWANFKGLKRAFFKYIDKLMCLLNSYSYSDSKSQNNFLILNGITKNQSIGLIGIGSLAGINIKKYEKVTPKLKIRSDITRFLFVGRLVKDKGIEELIKAFSILESDFSDVELILVGPFEKDDPVDGETIQIIKSNSKITSYGFQPDPERHILSSDIFCLPSFREGFGTVVIEAAILGKPTIGTLIPGLIDSVVDGETGILVKKGSVSELAVAMKLLYQNVELREKLGAAAQVRAIEEYDHKAIAEKQVLSYVNRGGFS